ncbi:MAG: hypothetical protein EBR67_08800, partial [Proteobacteria bacterium]|nr:hypothetical protein [Pseudomonadota bacterium]
IKLLKIWRELNKLDFPSIYLEYLLIKDVLLYKSKNSNNLGANFFHVLQTLAQNTNNCLYSRLIDPANSNNVLSDLLTKQEKEKIISAAQKSISKPYWEEMIY